MSEDIRSLIQEHHAFYEVLPHYVMLDDRHAGRPPGTRRIQGGFDVDIYGVNVNNTLTAPGPDPDYTLGLAELRKIAQQASSHSSDCCAVEVIPFRSTAILDPRTHSVEGMVRLRIRHYRGLDQPSGLPEQRALDELEQHLKDLGIARR